jgi:hypothetical protein
MHKVSTLGSHLIQHRIAVCRLPICTTALSFRPRIATNTSVTMSMSSQSQSQLKFSEGSDGSKFLEETNTLLETGWRLDEDQMGVQKTYYFKTYTKALVCDKIQIQI